MSYEEYQYLLPEDSEICAVVNTEGDWYYGSSFVGLGFTFRDALKDAARKYMSISLDPSDYDESESFDKDYTTGERGMYLFYLDPAYIYSAMLHNFTLEESVGKTKSDESEGDEYIIYSRQVHEIVNELNVRNKFKKFHSYYNYFSLYADNPDDSALREEFDKLTEKFANKYPNMRFSIYRGKFAGTTADDAIKNLLYIYDMGDTALAKLTPEIIPKNARITDEDTESDKIEFRIPCEVLNAAKHGDSLEELVTYWSEFGICDYYDNLIDEADALLNAGDNGSDR